MKTLWNIFKTIGVIVLLCIANISYAEDKCVPPEAMIRALEDAMIHMEKPSVSMTDLEKAKIKRYKEVTDILQRAKKYGVCVTVQPE